jgi:site-specific DNA-methyltransferase (cytosine-N4-specific)
MVTRRTAKQIPLLVADGDLPDGRGGVIEVDELPTLRDEIANFSTFTFTPETARRVTDFTHGLHVYPAKFIPQIPAWSFEYAGLGSGNVILDPFCGSGTALSEARIRGINSHGLDVNPLARLLTKVKTTPLFTSNQVLLQSEVMELIGAIQSDQRRVVLEGQPDFNLHPNWQFWYPRPIMEGITKIKRHIRSFRPTSKATEPEAQDLRDYFIACLSSVLKRCSYFDERQIKVRRHKQKSEGDIPDPLRVFKSALLGNLPGVAHFTEIARKTDAYARVHEGSATHLPLEDNSIDHIVTSPPYMNAIDYSMVTKYSLFVLDLVSPELFKEHCREYVGMTERAVRAKDFGQMRLTGYPFIDRVISEIWSRPMAVDKNRAFIVWQYFSGMKQALSECARVLKPGKLLVLVVGDNMIRKQYVPTHLFLQKIADDIGFEIETTFYHRLRNIRLKVNRNVTGGKISEECVTVMRRV